MKSITKYLKEIGSKGGKTTALKHKAKLSKWGKKGAKAKKLKAKRAADLSTG